MNVNSRKTTARRSPTRAAGMALGLALAAAWVQPAPAAHLVTLYRFHGMADGMFPSAAPIVGPRGELYGMTMNGGDAACSAGGSTLGCGTVYELEPPSLSGGKWTEKVLYSFKGGSDGINNILVSAATPSLTLGEDGSLYGVTQGGGGILCNSLGQETDGCGTVFRLSPPKHAGGQWTETVLHRFTGRADGFLPTSSLLPGKNGVFYGATASSGGSKCGSPQFNTCGTFYELIPPKAPGGAWEVKVLYTFNPDEGYLKNDLTLYRGVIYGTTYGSAVNSGTAYALTPPARSGGRWSYQTLYAFKNGPVFPLAGLIVGSGVAYGTTSLFSPKGGGAVFALTQPAKPGATWNLETLLRFDGKNGSEPAGDLVAGKAGVLYGATALGGNGPCTNNVIAKGCGTVWQLTPPAKMGGRWTETVLYNFQDGRDGAIPVGISAGGPRVLYGATGGAGDSKCFAPAGCGTVFKLVP